jgi:hypothetical protein
MVASEPPDSTASNKGVVLDERRAKRLGGYLSGVEARPLAARSRPEAAGAPRLSVGV